VTSLVLPAFNPGPAIEHTWREVDRFLVSRAARSDWWEAVFVLDGCTDDTPERLARLATDNPRCRVLSYPINRGKGFAVRTGLLAARGAVRIFTDIDLAYPFEDVLRVAAAVRAGSPVVIGSRAHPDSRLQLPAAALGYAQRRAIQGRIFGAVARLVLPIQHRDTQAGLKGMTADVAESLLPHLACDGFDFDCELLTACARSGIPVTEVPVCVRYDSAASTTGMWSGVRMLADLWRIRRRWRNRAVPVVTTDRVSLPEPAQPRLPTAA
jgi:glycosyltransferase involved in cell wall biosynthesis